jgi:hypothetical protein
LIRYHERNDADPPNVRPTGEAPQRQVQEYLHGEVGTRDEVKPSAACRYVVSVFAA